MGDLEVPTQLRRLRSTGSSKSKADEDNRADDMGDFEVPTQVKDLRPPSQVISDWKRSNSVTDRVERWLKKEDQNKMLKDGCKLDLSGLVTEDVVEPLAHLIKLLLQKKAKIYSVDLGHNPLLGINRRWQDDILRATASFVKDTDIPVSKISVNHCQLPSEDALNASTGLSQLLMEIAMPNSQVKELDLSGNQLAAAIGHAPNSERNNEAMTIQDQILSVETVSLQGNSIDAEQLKNFLRYLTGDQKGRAEIVGAVTPGHNLTTLDLSFNAIGESGATAVANMLMNYPKIVHLDISCGEVPSKGLKEVIEALIAANSQLESLSIGDNVLDDDAGISLSCLLKENRSLTSLKLGSHSAFVNFQAYELVKDCCAPLQELVFLCRSLNIEDQCKFIFGACRQCVDLSSLGTGLVKVKNDKEKIGRLGDRPLTFLLTDGMERANTEKSNNEKSRNYLKIVNSRVELIKFLIEQRNSNGESKAGEPAEEKQPPFIDTKDANSAIHGIIRITEGSKVGEEWPKQLLDWRKEVVELMLGHDASRGFGDSRLEQLPIANAIVASAQDDHPNLVHNASVRQPLDAWEVKRMRRGNTVLQDAIEMQCESIACLIVKRNSVAKCTFLVNEKDVTGTYCSMTSADGEIRFDASPDYIGIDEPSPRGLVPVREAARLGMWSVVKHLRKAGCKDLELSVCGSNWKGQTVWHDLVLPKSCEDEQQMIWALELMDQFGCLAEIRDERGRLPLHWAAENNHYSVVMLLVDLHYARGQEHLLQYEDIDGLTPLALAVFRGHTKTVKKFKLVTQIFSGVNTHLAQEENMTCCRRWRWIWRNSPSPSSLGWPCSPYHLALLQTLFVSSYKMEGKRNEKELRTVCADMMEIFHTTKEGYSYRKRFLIPYLTKKVTFFIFWLGILWLMSKSVFVGGLFSTTRMSLGLQTDETSWYYNKNFFNHILDDEFPEDEAHFAKNFNEMTSPDDVWTFINGVLLDVLFPDGAHPGEVGPFSFLIGSPVIQNKPYIYGDCDGALMGIPKIFESITSARSCVTDQANYQNDVILPRSDPVLAKQNVENIDKDAWVLTSGVRISYAIYNTESQRILFSDLRVEFRPSGLVVPVPKTRVFLWMPINDIGSWLYPFILCTLFVGYSLYNVFEEIYQMYTEGYQQYFRKRSEMFDILRDFIHFVVVVMLIVLVVGQATIAKLLDPESDEPVTSSNFPVDLTWITYCSIHTQKIFGFTFLLHTFNAIKLLRLFPSVGPQMQAIGQTLVDGKVTQFLAFLFAFVIGCALAVNTIFGAEQISFATVDNSFFGMYRFVWGDWDFMDAFAAERIFGVGFDAVYGYLFFLLVTFVITGTLGNVFIAIVGNRYEVYLRESESDWAEDVNIAMATWYENAFRRKHPHTDLFSPNGIFAKSMKEWGESGGEHHNQSEDLRATSNEDLKAVRDMVEDLRAASSEDLKAVRDKVEDLRAASSEDLKAVRDKVEEMEAMLKTLLQHVVPPPTASV